MNKEYYFLDVPVRRYDREYPCKLIIKDKRNKGKKIDKNNIKMIVNVKTINLGTVDAFVSLTRGNLNLKIACEEKFLTKIEDDINLLEEKLVKLGYNVSISVEEKIEKVQITKFNEFFEEYNDSTINIKV